MGEVDRLSAKVVLGSGARTEDLTMDLRDETSSRQAGPRRGGRRGLDLTDNSQPSIRVATYMKRDEGIQILVRTIHGKTITIQGMSPSDHIGDLKDRITDKTHVHKNDYWLEYQGKPLEESYTLGYYHFENDCHVNMRARVRGG